MNESQLISALKESDLMKRANDLAAEGFTFVKLNILNSSFLVHLKKPEWHFFQLGDEIGSGENGHVKNAIDLRTLNKVAIKTVYIGLQPINDAQKLEAECCEGAKLAREILKDHPSITQVYETGVSASIASTIHPDKVSAEEVTIMELAKPLAEIRSIGNDMNKTFSTLMEFYDALKYFESQDVIFSDFNPRNIVFKNGTIKFTDFDANLLKRPPNAHHRMIHFLELLGDRVFGSTLYKPEHRIILAGLRNQTLNFLKDDEIVFNRTKFENGLKQIITDYSRTLCFAEGYNKSICQEKHGFFSRNTNPSNPTPSNLHLVLLSSLLISFLFQSLREWLKKATKNKGFYAYQIDRAMNLVVLAISFTISENYVLPSLLLLAESLSFSGLLSQTTSNYINILASVTFSPIMAFINGGQDETISQVYSSAVSYLGAVLGLWLYQRIQISDKPLMESALPHSRVHFNRI